MLTTEQLELRKKHLGASEAAAIFDKDPFQTAADVYFRKTIDAPVEDDEPTEAMMRGNRLEEPLLQFAEERLNCEIVRGSTIGSIVDPISGILLATPDGAIVEKNEGIEAKSTIKMDDWGDEGTDEVPDQVLIQCSHQMYVMGWVRVWVPVLMLTAFRDEWRMYCVNRNDKLCDTIAQQEIVWWNRHVVAREPPTDEPPPIEVMKRLHRQPQSLVMLGENDTEAVEEWLDAVQTRKVAQKDEDEAKAAVMALLGLDEPAEAAQLPDGRTVTYFSQRSSPSVDTKRLRAEFPKIYDGFVTQGSHRVMRLKKGR